MINCGGAVGASDLLQAPEEVIELDLAMPMVDLAHQVRLLHAPGHGFLLVFHALLACCLPA